MSRPTDEELIEVADDFDQHMAAYLRLCELMGLDPSVLSPTVMTLAADEITLLRKTLGDVARREAAANAQLAAWKDHARHHGCVPTETLN